jgi:hypothetical protein
VWQPNNLILSSGGGGGVKTREVFNYYEKRWEVLIAITYPD